MGSLKYEISQRCKALMQSGNSAGGKHTSQRSWKIYMNAAIKYGEWCKRFQSTLPVWGVTARYCVYSLPASIYSGCTATQKWQTA